MAAIAPVIILGTITVVATGYVFKKFVYDPHLTPFIEAAWDKQLAHLRGSPEDYQPHASEEETVALPVLSWGVSTAVPHPQAPGDEGGLRKRRAGFGGDDATSAEESRAIIDPFTNNPIVRAQDYTPRPAFTSQFVSPPEISLDAEVRSSVFNPLLPPNPLPTSHEHKHDVDSPSTTFSFLSLSQQSSPRDMAGSIDELSFASAAERYEMSDLHPGDSMSRDDVFSLADSVSNHDYDVVSSLSPPLSASDHSASPFSSPPVSSPVRANCIALERSSLLDDVEFNQSASKSTLGPERISSRGPMSVVSLSESGEEDWDAVGSPGSDCDS